MIHKEGFPFEKYQFVYSIVHVLLFIAIFVQLLSDFLHPQLDRYLGRRNEPKRSTEVRYTVFLKFYSHCQRCNDSLFIPVAFLIDEKKQGRSSAVGHRQSR